MVAETSGPLQLRAEDAEDLAIFSTFLQDALVPLSDMKYERAARRFILAVNRFRWAAARPGLEQEAIYERVACAVTIEEVSGVTVRGIDQQRPDRLLELLAILTGEPPETPGTTVLLVFAGGGRIKLDVDRIRCRLEDFGESWPTRWRPRHRVDTDEGRQT